MVLIVVLCLGAFNPLVEVVRAVNNVGMFRYEQLESDYSTLAILSPKLHSQYATYDIPGWYQLLLRDNAKVNTIIKQDKPIIRSNYDVYLDDNKVIYVRDSCRQEDIDRHFLLHVYPADEQDLPERRWQHGYDNLDFNFDEHGFRRSDKCIAVYPLPPYAIGHIKTGQYVPGEGSIWEGSFSFDE